MKRKKINEENGSALVLIIIAMALITITMSIISSQVNNQIRFNQNSYEDMQYKYLAEASIENTIYDIEKMLINTNGSKISDSHIGCPKVKFNGKKPNVHDKANGFKQLIIIELLDPLWGEYQSVLYNNISNIVGDSKAAELRDYYQIDIWTTLMAVFSSNGISYDEKDVREKIDTFNAMIDSTIKIIEDSSAKNKESKIKSLNDFKKEMIEIKCRLGLLSNDSITITKYISYMEDEEIKCNDKIKENMDIKTDENNELDISIKGYSSEKHVEELSDAEYEITAKVKFDLTDLNDIKYEILSYEHKRN